jgi:MarR family 2-MHQ and catechol resistance regulon transcriptional repressor
MPTHHTGPRREVRALDTCLKLLRAGETLSAAVQAELAPSRLSLGQVAVLDVLHHLGPMSQRELGRKLQRSNANVTTVVGNLERLGLIKRASPVEDRRVLRVSLTARGRRRAERLLPIQAATVTALMGALTATEQAQLGALCRKLGLAVRCLPPASPRGSLRPAAP